MSYENNDLVNSLSFELLSHICNSALASILNLDGKSVCDEFVKFCLRNRSRSGLLEIFMFTHLVIESLYLFNS